MSFEKETAITDALKQAVGSDSGFQTTIPRARRVFVQLSSDALVNAVDSVSTQYGPLHLSTITGLDNGEQLEVLYHFNCSSIELTIKTVTPYETPLLPSLTTKVPGATFYEREVHDLLGVQFAGHPNLIPLILPDGWPSGVYPLRKSYSVEALRSIGQEIKQPDEAPVSATESTFIIPFGPQHPGLKEPENFLFTVEGDKIVDVTVRLGYNHRGIEKALENQSFIQNQTLIERVCGICSCAHSQCYVQAVEECIGIEAPSRAQYIRVIASELNRIQSHLLWLGIAAYEVGFNTLFMLLWRDREIALRLLEQMTGNRVTYSLNVVGGVRRDVLPEIENQARKAIAVLRTKAAHYKQLLETEPTVLKRIEGVGLLTRAEAQELCAVGPVLRACGVKSDVRVDDPYAVYDEIPFNVITYDGGDIASMVWVRCDEIVESIDIIQYALKHMPTGNVRAQVRRRVPEGECVSRVEAPRGELIHYLRANGSDTPERYKLRCPTLANMMSVVPMLKRGYVADIPITLAAIDTCFACNDRMIFLNEAGERRIWTMTDVKNYIKSGKRRGAK